MKGCVSRHIPSFLWCHQESNRGHKDFQSFALPTELWHLSVFASAKVRLFPESCKQIREKIRKRLYFSPFAFNFSLFTFLFSLFFVPLHRF